MSNLIKLKQIAGGSALQTDVNDLKAAIGDGGSVATQISDAIDAARPDYFEVTSLAELSGTYQDGDVAVVKTLIADGKYSYAAYTYDEGTWKAMDGNYDASNVYFGSDLTITAPVGVQTIPSTGSKTLATSGKSVKQVMDLLFAQEKNPTKTVPTCSVTLSSAGEREVGTVITPTYSTGFNAGSYTYGPATGITATGWTVTDSLGATLNTANGSFDSFRIADGQTYKVTAKAAYSQGAMPVTNLGNEYATARIAAGETAAVNSSSFSSYRQYFMTASSTPLTLNSATIRSFATKAKFTTGEKTFTAAAGMKYVYVAVPAGKRITKVTDSNALNAVITGNFVEVAGGVNVDGATAGQDTMNYVVYEMVSGVTLGAISYKITLA